MSDSLPPYRLPRGGRNEAAGIVLGAAGAVVGTIGLAMWGATQYVALRLHFDPRLGAPAPGGGPRRPGVARAARGRRRGARRGQPREHPDALLVGLAVPRHGAPAHPPHRPPVSSVPVLPLVVAARGHAGHGRHLDDGHVDRRRSRATSPSSSGSSSPFAAPGRSAGSRTRTARPDGRPAPSSKPPASSAGMPASTWAPGATGTRPTTSGTTGLSMSSPSHPRAPARGSGSSSRRC